MDQRARWRINASVNGADTSSIVEAVAIRESVASAEGKGGRDERKHQKSKGGLGHERIR